MELFQRLCALSLDQWIQATERGLRHNNPGGKWRAEKDKGTEIGASASGP
ncbi:hypothetical protein [Streptomyces sp. NPDC054771]